MPATWTVRSKIQSIARQNRAGAKMQPCRTPEDVRKLSDIGEYGIRLFHLFLINYVLRQTFCHDQSVPMPVVTLAFSVAVSTLYNTFPPDVQLFGSLPAFGQKLEARSFTAAYT